jgi:ABC-type lipoprotein release transport system permease subunit
MKRLRKENPPLYYAFVAARWLFGLPFRFVSWLAWWTFFVVAFSICFLTLGLAVMAMG